MILLDTNVVSELMKREPETAVVAWLDEQPAESVWITAITVMEIRYGLASLGKSRRQQALVQAFEQMVKNLIEGRIASFDAEAAGHAAAIMAERKKRGKPVEVRDTMMAGIAAASRAMLATRNTQHFEDLSLKLANPWTERK
ncbi:MAG TPA: type II toxin-antitoxin system VapC family toxin [Candidatus Acidoferrum sp.]|nr:type II toxin-antitoxin system VapC family toxin [Candidatus Acidoferrum sp.]